MPYPKNKLGMISTIYPGDYVVWDFRKLGLCYGISSKEVIYPGDIKGSESTPNPAFLDLDLKRTDKLLKLFNKDNTKNIFYVDYSGLTESDESYQVVVYIIDMIKNKFDLDKVRETIIKKDLRDWKHTGEDVSTKSFFFFDKKNEVILIVSTLFEQGYKKAKEISKIIEKELPFMEKFC